MFSNLTQGSILYGIETKGELKLFTAPIETVSFPRPKSINPTFGQLPEMVIDIVATVNGERREFKQVPSNTAIADFGPETLVLADSRESLNGYIASIIQNTKNSIANIQKLEKRLPEYERVYSELNPSIHSSANDEVIKNMQNEMQDMKDQLKEILSCVKSGNVNT